MPLLSFIKKLVITKMFPTYTIPIRGYNILDFISRIFVGNFFSFINKRFKSNKKALP